MHKANVDTAIATPITDTTTPITTTAESMRLEEQRESDTPPLLPILGESMTKEKLFERVQTLYPGFRPNGILRFSSLMGLGRPSSLPKIWEGCVKPQKRPRSSGDSDDWTFDFGPDPTPDMLDNQDERFMAPVDMGQGSGRRANDMGRVMLDKEFEEWRFGPSRYWYDLYNVPQDGREYTYGYKLKVCKGEREREREREREKEKERSNSSIIRPRPVMTRASLRQI